MISPQRNELRELGKQASAAAYAPKGNAAAHLFQVIFILPATGTTPAQHRKRLTSCPPPPSKS